MIALDVLLKVLKTVWGIGSQSTVSIKKTWILHTNLACKFLSQINTRSIIKLINHIVSKNIYVLFTDYPSVAQTKHYFSLPLNLDIHIVLLSLIYCNLALFSLRTLNHFCKTRFTLAILNILR